MYRICNGFNIGWIRICDLRMEAKYVINCPWSIYGAKKTTKQSFIVKRYNREYKCYRSLTNKQANVNWIAKKFINKFRRNNDYGVSQMLHDLQEKYNLQYSNEHVTKLELRH